MTEGKKRGVSMIQSGRKKSILKPSKLQTDPAPKEEDVKEETKTCVHSRGGHGLECCPEITVAELSELLNQLGGGEEGPQGNMIFQDEDLKGTTLKKTTGTLTCVQQRTRWWPQSTSPRSISGEPPDTSHKCRYEPN